MEENKKATRTHRVFGVADLAAWLLGMLAVAVFVWACLGVIRRILAGRQLDFFHFHEAAIAVVQGTNIYASGTGGYIYPPLVAVLFVPFAFLEYGPAVLVWLVINIGLIALVLIAGWKTLVERFKLQADWRTRVSVISLSVIMTSEQIRWELILGQTDTLTMAGCALALLWLDKRPLLAGIILGGISSIKYQALLFLPYLLVRRRWTVAIGVVGGGVVIALLPALVFGWEKNLSYLAVAFGGMLELVGIDVGQAAAVPVLVWERSITLTSGIARTLQHFGYAPSLAFPVAALLGGLVLGAVWWIYRNQGIPLLLKRGGHAETKGIFPPVVAVEWCGLLIAMSIFSPQGTKRHMFLLLLTNLTIAFLLWTARARGTRWILLIGIALAQLTLRLPPTPQYQEAAAVWDFIAGPSWGILLLCFAFVYAGLQESKSQQTSRLARFIGIR